MHVLSTPRRRRSASIALGAALVAVSLTGCGDDEPSATADRQLEAANRIYRTDNTTTSSTNGRTGGSGWWWGSRSGGSSDSSESSSGTHGSQRGGFGSSGHHFSFGS